MSHGRPLTGAQGTGFPCSQQEVAQGGPFSFLTPKHSLSARALL